MRKIAFAWLLILASASGVSATYQAGTHYKAINPEQPRLIEDEDKVEVVELFWYGCPHCHKFQRYVDRWLKNKPANVAFVRMPAIFRESWVIHAKAFYAAEMLGVLEQTHKKLFNAIHSAKNKNEKKYYDEASLLDFYEAQGIDRKKFKKALNSFAVHTKVRRARQMSRRYGIEGTPAVVVNGKYRTGPAMAGSYDRIMRIADELVAMESK